MSLGTDRARPAVGDSSDVGACLSPGSGRVGGLEAEDG
jgi:hypothetical protein